MGKRTSVIRGGSRGRGLLCVCPTLCWRGECASMLFSCGAVSVCCARHADAHPAGGTACNMHGRTALPPISCRHTTQLPPQATGWPRACTASYTQLGLHYRFVAAGSMSSSPLVAMKNATTCTQPTKQSRDVGSTAGRPQEGEPASACMDIATAAVCMRACRFAAEGAAAKPAASVPPRR